MLAYWGRLVGTTRWPGLLERLFAGSAQQSGAVSGAGASVALVGDARALLVMLPRFWLRRPSGASAAARRRVRVRRQWAEGLVAARRIELS